MAGQRLHRQHAEAAVGMATPHSGAGIQQGRLRPGLRRNLTFHSAHFKNNFFSIIIIFQASVPEE